MSSKIYKAPPSDTRPCQSRTPLPYLLPDSAHPHHSSPPPPPPTPTPPLVSLCLKQLFFLFKKSIPTFHATSQIITLPKPRINLFKTSFSFLGTFLWKTIPTQIKSCNSLTSFNIQIVQKQIVVNTLPPPPPQQFLFINKTISWFVMHVLL